MRFINANKIRRKLPLKYRKIVDQEPTVLDIEDVIDYLQNRIEDAQYRKIEILKQDVSQMNAIRYEKIKTEIKTLESIKLMLKILLI